MKLRVIRVDGFDAENDLISRTPAQLSLVLPDAAPAERIASFVSVVRSRNKWHVLLNPQPAAPLDSSISWARR
jgi:hypothetical protein